MATEKTVQATEAVEEKPFYLEPSFTSETWSDGIINALTSTVDHSMRIKEDDLLTFEQRLEKYTRSFIFDYQLEYAKKEYEILQKEFEKIEAKLNRQEEADAVATAEDADAITKAGDEDKVFKEPVPPTKKNPKKKTPDTTERRKTRSFSASKSSSESGLEKSDEMKSEDKEIKPEKRSKKGKRE